MPLLSRQIGEGDERSKMVKPDLLSDVTSIPRMKVSCKSISIGFF